MISPQNKLLSIVHHLYFFLFFLEVFLITLAVLVVGIVPRYPQWCAIKEVSQLKCFIAKCCVYFDVELKVSVCVGSWVAV